MWLVLVDKKLKKKLVKILNLLNEVNNIYLIGI